MPVHYKISKKKQNTGYRMYTRKEKRRKEKRREEKTLTTEKTEKKEVASVKNLTARCSQSKNSWKKIITTNIGRL